MRDYYNNSEVTLIAIDTELGKVDKESKIELAEHIIKKIVISS